MSGIKIEINIEDKGVKDLLGNLRGKLADLTPAMKEVGEIVKTSVTKNFEVGGRPPWQKSKRAIKQGGQTLVDTGKLKNSQTYRAFNDRVEIGTHKPYAAVHQFGFSGTVSQHVKQHTRKVHSRNVYKKGKKTASGITTVKAHGRNMRMNLPARPFLVVQDEDMTQIKKAIEEYITK